MYYAGRELFQSVGTWNIWNMEQLIWNTYIWTTTYITQYMEHNIWNTIYGTQYGTQYGTLNKGSKTSKKYYNSKFYNNSTIVNGSKQSQMS